jgi:hypothetical protein
MPANALPPYTIKQIDTYVCERVGDTHMPTNAKPWVVHRQIAMYLMRLAGYSLPRIGLYFRRRQVAMHHTTVFSSCRKIEQWRLADSAIDAQLRELQSGLAHLPEKREDIVLPKRLRVEETLRQLVADILDERLKASGAGSGIAV